MAKRKTKPLKKEGDENYEKVEEEKDVDEMKETIDEEKPLEPEDKITEEKPVLIPVSQFCDSIGKEGVEKFALVRMEAAIKEGLIPEGPLTREEWEKYYLEKIKSL